MPKYKVITKGFFGGKIYSPNGKRNFVSTSKPLKKVPAWLEIMKAESAAEEKKRIAAEKKETSAAQEKIKSDRHDVEKLTFMGEGAKATVVETL